MKIVQTFWTKGQAEPGANFLDIKAGWIACEYHWMSWALSCLQAKCFFNEVELVTDELGKEILINKLKLPYTKVSTTLEGKLNQYPSEIWALAKIFSYSEQKEPFLHIDGDVFLWEKPNEEFLNSSIISQNIEKNLAFYRPVLDEINETFSFIPTIFKKETYNEKDIYASNAGLIGGNDLSFFKTYCKQAFEFIENNKSNLNNLNTLSNINFIFEQYALFQLAKKENKSITYYFDKIIETPLYEDFIRFQNLPFVKLIHPVGGFKKHKYVCDFIAKYLRYAYAEYYYRIINVLVHEKAELISKAYTSTKLKIPQLISNHNIVDNPYALFERTSAAILKWTSLKSISEKNWLIKIDERKFKALISENIIDEVKKEIVFEIFCLDSSKHQLYNNILGDKLNEVNYNKDASLYKKHLHIFSLKQEQLLPAKLRLNEFSVFLNLNWVWDYYAQDQINNLLEKNFIKPKADYQIVLIPNFIRNVIEEYYLDEFDIVIIEIIKELNCISINVLLENLKDFFDREEVEQNPGSFKGLVVSSVKRLTYAGVLETFLED